MEVRSAVNIVKSKRPMIEPWETSERTRKRRRIIKDTLIIRKEYKNDRAEEDRLKERRRNNS